MSQTTGSNPYDTSKIGTGNARLLALQKLTGGDKKKGGANGIVVPQFPNASGGENQTMINLTRLSGQAAADRALDLKKGGGRKSRRKSRKRRRKTHKIRRRY